MNSSNQEKRPKLFSYYRQSKPFLRADILLLAVLLTAAVLAAVFSYTGKPLGERAEIYIGGELVGTYDLNQNKEIVYEIGITVHIHDGEIAVTESDCPDQLCVHMGAISKTGDRIICAPNKFVVVIRGENNGYGAITGRRQS